MAAGGGGFPGPQPGVGELEEVTVAGYPLRVLPGTYKRDPAPRFGEKVSTGDLRYQDFNPYESAASYSSFERGYGLRRFSDLPQTENPEGFYAEANNVDCRSPGICLSPALTSVDLSGGVVSTSVQPLWWGEWAPTAGSVTGTHWVMVGLKIVSLNMSVRVYYFTAAGTAVDTGYVLWTGAGVPAPNINVIQAGSQLIIGYGSLAVAQFITTLDNSVGVGNVQDTATNNLYVYASAADRAAVYIAGGAAVTNTNTVLSAALTAANPAHAFATAANAVTCQDTTQPITALAPGGGVSGVLVFVGKTGQLGMIDTSSTYHNIQSFGSNLSTNCRGMTWWLAGNDKTDVGTILVFPRGRSLWSYNTSGSIANMAPEGREGFRPINARGVVMGIQPTSHFLYYAIQTASGATGTTYVIANDGISGANHTYLYQKPTGNVQTPPYFAMGITSLFGSNPLLYLSNAIGPNLTSFSYVTLPADGDWPPAESVANGGNCTFKADTGSASTPNTLLLPDIDFGFPDEDKIPTVLRLIADNLTSGAQYIVADYAVEGSSSYTNLGTFFISPIQDIPFPSLVFKRISLRLTFHTTSANTTPILNAVSLRASINPKQYTLWSFSAAVPAGATKIMSDSPYDANTVINALWADYKAGTPVAYTDRWNKQWLVRILDFHEAETYQENLKTPGTGMQMTLLELYGTGLESAWDKSNTIWSDPNSTWG